MKKIIVAVHGIGDQVRNETVLATAVRFCDHYRYEGAIALGAFHGFPPDLAAQPPGGPVPEPALFVQDPPPFKPCAGLTDTIGFVEVHWADIARAQSDEEHTLHEAKAWARSIVNRVRVFATQRDPANAAIDYRRIGDVLEEIIDTIHVIESLLFLSAKAGLGDFKLRKILDGFLGDVQLVTEFAPIRETIVKRFTAVMEAIEARYEDAEIYVVAHSEGTVVSFLGLLEADLHRSPWLKQVRGFMTMGSPIDKHLILWPRLFDRYAGPCSHPPAPIPWVNYVDYADPVGFDLDTARDWLLARKYRSDASQPVGSPLFAFEASADFSFRRYAVPGKAHVDYWSDPEVFSHFIKVVVDPRPVAKEEAARLAKGPPSRWWVPLVCYGVGYLLPFLVIHLAVYVLCKAVYGYFDPDDTRQHPNFVRTVLALSWLIAGATVWLRIVRLTRTWGWFLIGMALYAALAAGYWLLVSRMTQPPGTITELTWFEAITAGRGWPLGLGALAGSLTVIAFVLLVNASVWRRLMRWIFRS